MIVSFRLAPAAVLILILVSGRISAADGPPFGRGAAKVVAANGTIGVLAPQGEIRGSVYFKEVSGVATEVAGKVVEVLFEDGDDVVKDQPLVKLDDQLLRKDLGAVRARLERDRTMLEDAEVRLSRSENLVERGLSPAEQLDQTRFSVQALRHSVSASEAEVERIETLVSKCVILAPFDGIVLDRQTNLGEWKSAGQSIGMIARRGAYEIVASIPETSAPYVAQRMELEVQVGAETLTGKVSALIPRGDIATRTFPLKVQVQTDQLLMEGMTALVRTPIGERVECFLVPRDALINQQGSFFVITIQDGVARKHPVRVLGYQDAMAGIDAPELGPAQLFAIKGHERLNDGDHVELVPVADPAAPARATGF
jgi:RND family efflux transporter MFP subunit